MIDNKTNYLRLPLPNEQNMLEDDCPRIRQSFQKLDTHAADTDTALAARLKQADAADTAIAALQERATATEKAQAVMDGALTEQEQKLLTLEEQKADAEAVIAALANLSATVQAEQAENFAAHDASLSAHDALVKRITVGSLSPIIGVCCVEDGGGSGLWFNIDATGQPVSPPRSYFDYHPTYNALRRVLVDGQMMQEHHKFYYKAFEIASGPFKGRRGRLISPDRQDGFKPFPSFMKDGQEVETWYCGTFAGTNEGGTPLKVGSRPGKVPLVNVNFPTMQQYCRNRNAGGVVGFDMWNIYQAAEIQLLALIEAATPDFQAFYGRGRVDADSAANVDATDVATASWRGHIGLWGNVWQMCAGLEVTTAGKVRLWKNDGSKEWVDTGFVCPAYDGTNVAYMQTLKSGAGNGFDFEDIFFPATTTTSAAAGTIPDGFWGRYGNAGNVCYLGASWGFAGLAGLFACNLSYPAGDAGTTIGCRLAKL